MSKRKKTISLKNLMIWQEHKKELIRDARVMEAYRELQPEFAVIEKIIKARIKEGITQKELAIKMKTKQSAISRLESGKSNPSLNFLKRFAHALNCRLELHLLAK